MVEEISAAPANRLYHQYSRWSIYQCFSQQDSDNTQKPMREIRDVKAVYTTCLPCGRFLALTLYRINPFERSGALHFTNWGGDVFRALRVIYLLLPKY